jgi:hypothetical protein
LLPRKRNILLFFIVFIIVIILLFPKINIEVDVEENSTQQIDYSFRYSQIKGYFQEGEYTYFIVWKGSDLFEIYEGCVLVYSEKSGFVNAYKYKPFIYSSTDKTYMAVSDKYFCLKIENEVLVYDVNHNKFKTYLTNFNQYPQLILWHDSLYISDFYAECYYLDFSGIETFCYDQNFHGEKYINDYGIYSIIENNSIYYYYLVNKKEVIFEEDVPFDEISRIKKDSIYYKMPELKVISNEYKELFRQYK